MTRTSSILALAACVLWAAPALAGPADIFGLGGASMGRGGGGVASARGAEAAWLNPALLAHQKYDSFFVGYQAIGTSFGEIPPLRWDTNVDGRIDDTDEPLTLGAPGGREDGVILGLRRGIGKRVGIGLAAFMPKDRLVRISSMEPTLPDYFLYDRRLQTFDLVAGAGVEVWRGLSLGLGAQVLAGADVKMAGRLALTVTSADEGDDDMAQLITGTSFDMSDIDLDVKPKLVPVAALGLDLGKLADPLDGLKLGATWRGNGGLPVDIDVNLEVDANADDVGDLDPLTLALLAQLKLAFLDHAIPARWTAGASYAYKDYGLVTADVIGTKWSAVIPSVANVDEENSTLSSPLFQSDDPGVSDGNAYDLELRDTVGARVGLEVAPLSRDLDKGRIGFLRLALRGGWAYDPSPLVSQGRSSAFLDADRMAFSGGLGVEHGDPFGLLDGPVRWDLFFQRHILASGELARSFDNPYTAGAPVDGVPIPISGRLWTAGLQWSLAY